MLKLYNIKYIIPNIILPNRLLLDSFADLVGLSNKSLSPPRLHSPGIAAKVEEKILVFFLINPATECAASREWALQCPLPTAHSELPIRRAAAQRYVAGTAAAAACEGQKRLLILL
jgi:hypothetical protein